MIDPVVISIKKTRNIRSKGVQQPKRVSRSGAKEDALVDEIAGKESRELKSLLKTGGSGGNQRPEIPDKIKWNLYAKENNGTTIMLPTRLERERQNEKAFASVSEIENISDDEDEVIQEDKKIRRGTRHICNLNKVECTINENFKCYCHVDTFIQYCEYLDNKFKELPDLYSKFKKENRSDKIKVNDSGLGITTDLDIVCSSCNTNALAPVARGYRFYICFL